MPQKRPRILARIARAAEPLLYAVLWSGAVAAMGLAVGHYAHWTAGLGTAGVFLWAELFTAPWRRKGG